MPARPVLNLDVSQVDIDVHRFSYMARVGLSGVKEQLKTLVLDHAFVIQGESDDELHEQILGGLRLAKLDSTNLHEWPIADAADAGDE